MKLAVETPIAAPVLPAETRAATALTKRSLSHVSWLASLLASLGYLQDNVEYEAAIEEDGSAVPADMLAALKGLGAVLVAMTIEEVDELLAGTDADDLGGGDIYYMASGPGLKRQALAALRRLGDGQLAGLLGVARDLIAGRKVEVRTSAAAPFARVGKAISAANERCLRAAHDHVKNAAKIIADVVDPPDDADPDQGTGEDDDTVDDERALRARKAAALARKAKHAAP